jgi:hypothetical protein
MSNHSLLSLLIDMVFSNKLSRKCLVLKIHKRLHFLLQDSLPNKQTKLANKINTNLSSNNQFVDLVLTRSIGTDEKASRSGGELEVEVGEERWLSLVRELHAADSDSV